VISLNSARTFFPGVAAVLFLAPLQFGALQGSQGFAQAAAKTGIADTWQGTLHAGKDLRIVLKISKGADGALKSNFYSIDQGGQPIAVTKTTFVDGELKLDVDDIGGTYDGKAAADEKSITGTWKQGDKPLPLVLERATETSAWEIPAPPAKMEPMAKDADPSFEVATIKLTDPKFEGKGFGGPPGHFGTRGTTMDDLLMFAYKLHPRQISGAPDWLGTEKYDIQGKADTPGQANDKQTGIMMQKLLASRFGLKFHMEKREMSAFVLTVAKDGPSPKMTKSTVDPNDNSSFYFTKLGHLTIRNLTMDDFAHWMQTVLDRPVVDHTNLPGHFDGKLNWTPDETQFAIFGNHTAPPEEADAPPPLSKAIQEQLGLKLDVMKVPVDVMVIDHVEKPSEN
jgi:uncharacterized protein (TIGR03435 family)